MNIIAELVILSEVWSARSADHTQSKDPYALCVLWCASRRSTCLASRRNPH